VIAAVSYPPIPIFELGPLQLSLHGFFAGLGFVAGAALMVREARRRGFDDEKVISILTWAVVASILGARFFTIPAHMSEPGYGLSDALSPAGDYSIIGGYAGGIIAGFWRMRRLGADVGAHMDMAAAGLALGAVVGRIGDVAIVEHLGGPTSFFLGYELQPGYDVSPQHDVLERLCEVEQICGPWHHTGLYDMLGAAVLVGLLLLLRRHWTGRRYGQLFVVWGVWYGFQRFLIDFARLGVARDGVPLPDGTSVSTIADSVMGPFTGSQWGALAIAVAAVWLFFRLRVRSDVVTSEGDVMRGATPPDQGATPPDEDAVHPGGARLERSDAPLVADPHDPSTGWYA
jgi:prolipoprotein diacylglyceryltransferase